MKLNLGKNKFSLPVGVLSNLARAGERDLKILLYYAADPATVGNSPKVLEKALGYTEAQVLESLAFWEESGIILNVPNKDILPKETAKKTETKATEPPAKTMYTTPEVNDVLEKRKLALETMHEAEKILGRVLSSADCGRFVALIDGYQIPNDAFLLILSRCEKQNKVSWKAIENYIASMDANVWQDPHLLEDYFAREDEKHSLENFVRKTFGIGNRAWTKKEKEYLKKWDSYHFSEEMLLTAYEKTIQGTGVPSLAYCNSILENWCEKGYKTTADLEEKDSKPKMPKVHLGKGKPSAIQDNDLFNRAVQRSLEEAEKGEKS